MSTETTKKLYERSKKIYYNAQKKDDSPPLINNIPTDLSMSIPKERFIGKAHNPLDTQFIPSSQANILVPIEEDLQRPFKYRKARTKDWVYARNVYGIPKRFNEIELKQFGETWAVIRCKSIIIKEVLSAKWKIIPQNPRDYSVETQEKINAITQFLKAINRDSQPLEEILEPFLDDMLTLGYGVAVKTFRKEAYKQFSGKPSSPQESYSSAPQNWRYIPSKIPAGLLREVKTFDAQYFFAHPDYYGYVVGWWQRVYQGYGEFFSNREIIYDVCFRESHDYYGISPTAVVRTLVNILINSVDNTDKYVSDGAIPPGILALSKITPAEFDRLKKRWDVSIKGNPSDIPIMSAGDGEMKFIPLVIDTKDIKQLDTLEIYAKIVMSVFHVTPNELGDTSSVNKASAEQQAEVQKRAAVFPFLDKTEVLLNKTIIREFDPENAVKFEWIRPVTKEDEKHEWDMIDKKLNSGFYTINDIKKQMGEPLKKWGNVPFIASQWIGEALQSDKSLLGFRDLEEQDPEKIKMNFLNRQIIQLIEQLTYGLNNNQDINPIALRTLTKLRMLKEQMNLSGTLTTPAASVIDIETIADHLEDNTIYTNTRDVFNRFRSDEISHLTQGKTMKAIEIDNIEDMKFLQVAKGIGRVFSERSFQDRLDRLHLPIIGKLFRGMRMLMNKWYKNAIPSLDENIIKNDPFLNSVLQTSISREEFTGVLFDQFSEAYSLGYSLNNNAKPLKKLQDIPIEQIQPEARQNLDRATLRFADKLINESVDDVRRIIDDGLASGLSIPNIRNNLRATIPVQKMNGETKEDFNKRKISHDKKLMRIARTEVIKSSNRGRFQQLKELGVSHWEYHAHLDERNKNEKPSVIDGKKTFKSKGGKIKKITCRNLHGEIFPIGDTRFLPVIHPNGRCSIHGVFDSPTAKYISKQAPPQSWFKLGREQQLQRQKRASPDSVIQSYPVDDKTKGKKDEKLKSRVPSAQTGVKDKIKGKLKMHVTSLLVGRQLGKVFNNLNEMPSVALDLKDDEITFNGNNISLYKLKDRSIANTSVMVSQANSVEGLLSNEIIGKLGDLSSHGQIINQGLDFIVTHNIKPITGGIKGFIADRLTSMAKSVAGAVKLSDIEVLSKGFEELDAETGQDVSKLLSVVDGYTISDMAELVGDITNRENWAMDSDGKLRIKSEMVDEIVDSLEIPEAITKIFDKVTEIQDKYVTALEKGGKERESKFRMLESFMDNIHEDFGQDISNIRNRFFQDDKNKEEDWGEYLTNRLNRALQNNARFTTFLADNEDMVLEAGELLDAIVGKQVTSTTVDVLIPEFIDKPSMKLTKLEVRYRPTSGAQKCGNCRYFVGNNTCSIVAGFIRADFVCDRWDDSQSTTI